jgi:hypothetical protein
VWGNPQNNTPQKTKMVLNTKKREEVNVQFTKAQSTRGGKGSLVRELSSLDVDEVVEIPQLLEQIKQEGYVERYKPIREAINNLPQNYTQKQKDEAILEGFFKNLLGTGSFCYFKNIQLGYSDEINQWFWVKGVQSNLLAFTKGKYYDESHSPNGIKNPIQ